MEGQGQGQQMHNAQPGHAPEAPSGYSAAQAASAATTAGAPRPPIQPHYAAPLASRDHAAAGLLALLLGMFGVHKFYLGYNAQGFTLFALTVIGGLFSFGLVAGVVWIVAAIEGITYFCKSQSEFERIYIYGKREWF